MYVMFNLSASEELSMGGMKFTTFDLGGHAQGELHLQTFFQKVMGWGQTASKIVHGEKGVFKD